MFRESALFSMVTPSLTTALCSWSTSTGAQIRASSRWSEFWYSPVTPITTGIRSTFGSPHSRYRMFLKSAYLTVFLWVVVAIPMSLVIPISIICASLVLLL